MSKIIGFLRNNRGFLLFLALLFLVRGSILDWHPVPTGSMKPTILEGDVIVENKLAYDLRLPFSDIVLMQLGQPKRGDIIVFTSEKSGKRLVKRLVGLPGETIEVINDQILINGDPSEYRKLAENDPRIPATAPDREPGYYVMESTDDMAAHIMLINDAKYNPHRHSAEITIPAQSYFFMGDNRDDSSDSRLYGVAPRSELRGRAFGLLLSVRSKENYAPRWERFFSELR
ncbi:MAG: signal peptidase I [Leucothrix sp.]